MKEFKLKKVYALIIYLGAPLFIAVFGALILLPVWDKNTDMNTYWVFVVMGVIMIPLMFLGLLDAIKSSFVIGSDSIYTTGVLGTRELRFDEIKGYKVNDKYIIVEPCDKDKKNIKINKYLSGSDEIVNWLKNRYPDLDMELHQEEIQEILADENLGFTEEERALRLTKARNIARVLNWTGGLAAAWLFFYPNPYSYALVITLCIPLVSILSIKLSKGLIRFDERKNSPYPSVIAALFLPAAALMLRAIVDYQADDYNRLLFLLPVTCCVLVMVLFIGSPEFDLRSKQGVVTFIGIIMLMTAYGFGVIITVNCTFDDSAPQIYHARILEKHVMRGKLTTYNLNITPWGIHTEPGEVEVDKQLYGQLSEGDEVSIYLMKGRLDIPWYVVGPVE